MLSWIKCQEKWQKKRKQVEQAGSEYNRLEVSIIHLGAASTPGKEMQNQLQSFKFGKQWLTNFLLHNITVFTTWQYSTTQTLKSQSCYAKHKN